MKEKLKKIQCVYIVVRFIVLLLKTIYFSVFTLIFRVFPINNKKIMIVSYYGKSYGDSGKYIVEEILKKSSNYKIFWAIKNNSEKYNTDIKYVKFNSIIYLYHLVTSKYWINNTRFQNGIRKRKNQVYFQVWHGSLPLKKVEFDALSDLSTYYKKCMINDNKMIDYMISNSNFCTNMYREAFKYNGEILEIGTPRNDILVNNKNKIKEKVANFYSLNKDDCILFYAPTFRNKYSHNPYDIDFTRLINKLNNLTHKNWNVIVRLHPLVKYDTNVFKNMVNCINGTNYPDSQELIAACDLLITDYSSIMFDALIANKNVLLYANDIEKYNSERGMYFDFEQLPFLTAKDNTELLKLIDSVVLKSNNLKYEEFRKKVGLHESGNSSEIIADIILENDLRKYKNE